MQHFHVKNIWIKKKISKEESLEDSSSSSPEEIQVVPLPSWEDMFLQGLEMMRHVEQKKKKVSALSNPWRYNL
jgi:hypothetical protein